MNDISDLLEKSQRDTPNFERTRPFPSVFSRSAAVLEISSGAAISGLTNEHLNIAETRVGQCLK